MTLPEIIVFASGGGSNFQALIDTIENHDIKASIRCLIVDRQCQAIERAKKHNIAYYLVNRHHNKTDNFNTMTTLCQHANLIVCAGYLSQLESRFVDLFKGKIINIHPSLLPKYGGKGMYGQWVHQAVIQAGESISGCTVHYIDSGLDSGEMIAQKKVVINQDDDADSLQQKVLKQEHILLPQVIKKLLKKEENIT